MLKPVSTIAGGEMTYYTTNGAYGTLTDFNTAQLVDASVSASSASFPLPAGSEYRL